MFFILDVNVFFTFGLFMNIVLFCVHQDLITLKFHSPVMLFVEQRLLSETWYPTLLDLGMRNKSYVLDVPLRALIIMLESSIWLSYQTKYYGLSFESNQAFFCHTSAQFRRQISFRERALRTFSLKAHYPVNLSFCYVTLLIPFCFSPHRCH